MSYNNDVYEKWLTTADAAEMSGYHPEHLRELVREGKIEGRKFGIVWQISRESLANYLETAKKAGDKRWGPKSE